MNRTETTTPLSVEEKSVSMTDNLARRLVQQLLAGIRTGRLVVHDSSGTTVFGDPQSQLSAQVTIHSPAAYRRILFGGSIGAGEAYVDQLWDVDDLTGLVRILVANMAILDRMERGLAWLLRPLQLLRHLFRPNNRRGARANIGAHYDLGNEMYQCFLDESLMYSSAIFPSRESSLEEGSRYKLELICQRLGLRPSDHVLEIGTGWGGFALYAATEYGCRVTTTTISNAQYQLACERIKDAGLEEKITVLQQDYRELEGQFDKLVSIEMIEAVGHRYLPDFFKKCSELLKPDGTMLLQAITIRDQKYDDYVRSVDFIQAHIFPGGCLPSNHRMQELLARETDMVARGLWDFGFDYATTLNHWRQRFNHNRERLKELGYDRRFQRLWNFYLSYCEGGFLERSISVVHLLADKPLARQEPVCET